MRNTIGLCVSTIALLAAMPAAAQPPGGQRAAAPAAPALTLTVAGFPDGADIPVKFSQAAPGVATGEGLSPAISWTNVPAGTQALFLHNRDKEGSRKKNTHQQAHLGGGEKPAPGGRPPPRRPKRP